MEDLTVLTPDELFIRYRHALDSANITSAQNILMEYGRRGEKDLRGEPFENIFKRNPMVKEWYEKGAALREEQQ